MILRLPQLQVLDATGAQALGEIVSELEHRGITVLLKGPSPEHLRLLTAVGALDHLAHENHLFANLDDAIAHARLHVARATTTGAVTGGDAARDGRRDKVIGCQQIRSGRKRWCSGEGRARLR